MKAEMKDLRKRIEKDRRQLENLEESIVTDSVSCGKKGKKSLGTVKVTGRPDGAIERKKRSLKRKLQLQEILEADLLEKQTQAEEYIQSVEKSEFRMILRFFFIDDLTYAQTAERMNAAYLTELEVTSNAEDNVEVSLTFGINGNGQDGWATVTAKQQEIASYVFTDTQKTGA